MGLSDRVLETPPGIETNLALFISCRRGLVRGYGNMAL